MPGSKTVQGVCSNCGDRVTITVGMSTELTTCNRCFRLTLDVSGPAVDPHAQACDECGAPSTERIETGSGMVCPTCADRIADLQHFSRTQGG